jgi:hypothetical protein
VIHPRIRRRLRTGITEPISPYWRRRSRDSPKHQVLQPPRGCPSRLTLAEVGFVHPEAQRNLARLSARGADRTAKSKRRRRSRLDGQSRAAGAVLMSPAFQRWVEALSSARVPEGRCCIHPLLLPGARVPHICAVFADVGTCGTSSLTVPAAPSDRRSSCPSPHSIARPRRSADEPSVSTLGTRPIKSPESRRDGAHHPPPPRHLRSRTYLRSPHPAGCPTSACRWQKKWDSTRAGVTGAG